MLIDCHTHAFSEKIAAKAVEQLIQYYRIPTPYNGTLPELQRLAQEANLDAMILLVAATRPNQVKPAHDWILSLTAEQLHGRPRIYPFGTYHIDDPNWRQELDRLRAAGLKGIKLHPEFQGIDLADRRLDPFLEEIAGEFILMVHIGDPVVNESNLSTPRKVAALLDRFPKLTVIAAHLGGYCLWEDAISELAGRRIYLDTSSALAYIPPEVLRRLVDRHGTEHILYGSDYPLCSPRQALAWLDKMHWLSPLQHEAIAGKNCAALLGL